MLKSGYRRLLNEVEKYLPIILGGIKKLRKLIIVVVSILFAHTFRVSDPVKVASFD